MTGRATAGVERWIIDDQGMYIGAYVWFQSQSLCVEADFYGEQLADGSLAGQVTGTIPYVLSSSGLWIQAEHGGFGQVEGVTYPFEVSTEYPIAGTRSLKTRTRGFSYDGAFVYFLNTELCNHIAEAFVDPFDVSCVVAPGDRLDFSCQGKLEDAAGSNTSSLTVVVHYLNESGHLVGGSFNATILGDFAPGAKALTTTLQSFTGNGTSTPGGVAPSGAHYALATLTVDALNETPFVGNTYSAYVGDFSLKRVRP